MTETVYLVDTFSLMFQVFHAIRQPMTGAGGQPTNAVYGFTTDLRYLRNEVKPTHLVCALESPGPGERSKISADYKANRGEIPPDLKPQIPWIIEVIKAYNIPAISSPGWEADDVIATLSKQGSGRGMDVRIVTSDKDARQLLGPNVQMYNIRKKLFLDEAFLLEDWGIRPDQVIDFQSLVGDAVDNVPGVPLVGPKKARALLEKFGTLEEVLANADQAPGKKLQENLKTFAEVALNSRKLVTLNTDLPLEFDWDQAQVREPDWHKLEELFSELAFKRYAEEAREKKQSPKIGQASTKRKTLFRQWEVVDTPAKFAKFFKELQQQPVFCVDLETTSLNAVRADIVGWAICWEPDHGIYIPVQGPPMQQKLDPATVLAGLKPILEDSEITKINQNIKYDMLVLRHAGVELKGVGLDPMVGDYLLEAGARSHSLETLADRFLGRGMIPISDLIGKGAKQKSMAEVDVQQAAEYASEDADFTWQIAELVAERLKEENLWDLYWDLERPLISVLTEMEFAGIRVDTQELKRQSAELTERLEQLETEIHHLAGREFNIGSPKQLAAILFDELKLPIIKRTKTGASTDHEVLEELAVQHELPAKIIEQRQLAKLKGTYLDALPEMVNPDTGNIHCSFSQVVAATGRLSCSDPNLQNIPIRTEEGRRIRQAFVPSQPGWQLISADYSQVELRMLAHFSQDEALQTAFREGVDIHASVAAEIFQTPLEEVTSEQRRVAKAVNFGVIYGQSPAGLSKAIRISTLEAALFIDNYFDRYAGVEKYLETLLEECRTTGYARTILGRRRRIEGIARVQGRQRNLSERTAINTVIQGSAADLIKRAMLGIHARLKAEKHPARMLLQIHDELVFEAPAEAVDSLIPIARSEMCQALDLAVPLVVDINTGDNWLNAK